MRYRLVRESDASAYLEFFRSVASETDNLACSAKEAAAMTVEDEQASIRNTNCYCHKIRSGSLDYRSSFAKKRLCITFYVFRWALLDLNRRPKDYESFALTAEL